MGRLGAGLKTRWELQPRDLAAEAVLARELGLNPIIAAILASRGFGDPEIASRFLNPKISDFHDPSLLPDYEPAAKEVLGAKERGETIYVHGDYDVDGVTSAALLTRFLQRIGCKIVPHVPHRMKEGYGIHIDAIKWAKEQGASLFLTCDCGVSAHEQVDAATEAGLVTVITDHHELKETLPKAAAVINPHRPDSEYPFANLSGVGVALKFCAGLTRDLEKSVDGFYNAFLDLAVLGTVADVMPLIDENRIITKHGLPRLKETKKPGLQALLAVTDLNRPDSQVTARSIGYQIGPRINAVGRIDDAGIALDLMLTDDYRQAQAIAAKLDQLNHERRLETAAMVEQALNEILENQLDQHSALVVSREGWHPGIIGLVASRLVESHYRPSFVIAVGQDGIGKGSARSIKGFHLAEALREAQDLILGGGGHEMAAGFSIECSRIEDFRRLMASRAGSLLDEEAMTPVQLIDLEVDLRSGSEDLAASLMSLEPYGDGNCQPQFLARNVELAEVSPMRSPEHARLVLRDGASKRPGVVFGKGEMAAQLKGQKVDVIYKPEFNTFRGSTEFRWTIEDLRPAGDSATAGSLL